VTALGAALFLGSAASPASAHDPFGGVDEVDKIQTVNGEEVEVSRHGDPISDFTAHGARSVPAPVFSMDPSAGEARDVAPSCTTVSRGTDDTANAVQPSSSATIKVIYAYPTDVGNRLSTYAPVIQSGIKSVTERIAYETNDTKSLRFDLGTSAGPDCVDVQTVALSGPSSAYLAVPSQTFSLIRTELTGKVGALTGGARNYLVYADGIAVPGVAGEAQVRSDDTAAGAMHRSGGLWAMLYGRGGSDFFGSSTSFAPGTTSRSHVDTAIHEISHNLGAVQRSAPHHSASWHCLDESDILCYDDDGSGGFATYNACNSTTGQLFDCNQDDYFNPSPAPGSYLATHWNIYNSVFMCPVNSCAPGGVPSAPPSLATAASAAPDTKIVARPRSKTKDRTPTFGFVSTQSLSSFRCRIDGRPFRACNSPYTLSRQALKRHNFQVVAKNAAGEEDPTPASTSFKVKR
jgi:antitoxin (DNA-binding transcriptional repressor) of toxin-antitoxin stability system